jgi:hypothetical protein
MLRKILLIITFISLFNSVSWGANKAPVFTQKDFARLIMQQFSWNSGLSKEPADRDYLAILGGKRTFRYEAENAYNILTDRVTVRNFPLYGEFTGQGWIMGVSNTTTSTFTILLPIAGEYEIKAVIKGNGFVWSIADQAFKVDSNSKNFQEIVVGKMNLKAGATVIKLSIPPEGAIDSFSLTAPDHTPVQPFMGWRFKEGLTAVRMAEIAVTLTSSFDRLPDADPALSPLPIAVSEKVAMPANAGLTSTSYLGRYSSPQWVRANFMGATLPIPVTVSESGYFGIKANIMGEKITGSVNNIHFNLNGKSYLDKVDLGVYRLDSGDNTLTIVLPPTGGIDNVEFRKKSSTPDDFLRLAGVPGPADRLIGAEEAAALLKSIKGNFSGRK